jgi:flagellar motility protein MotE (MotC chaperone)
MRYFRLLPAVMLVSVALLGLKGEGLIRGAWAEGQKAATEGDQLAKDTAPLAGDPAADTAANESPSEADVMSSLARRRATLDNREGDIAMRDQVLKAAEARVDAKIATLKQLQEQINALIAQRDADQQKQVASLVKTYSAMKAKDAARIFNTLPDEVLVPVAQQMKSDVLAPVLAGMTADNAQRLTQKLASRLKMPETPAAVAPAPAPIPPGAAPGPQTGAPPAATPAAAAPKAGK